MVSGNPEHNHDRTKIVGEIGAAVGLAGLALAVHELHKRRVQPESLRDSRLAKFHGGACLRVAGVMLGGEEIMPRDILLERSGLADKKFTVGSNFMEERGLAASTMLEAADGRLTKHYMLTDETLQAVVDDPDGYRMVLAETVWVYQDFSLGHLRQRLVPPEEGK